MRWQAGDRIAHRFNPDLGSGEVTAIEGRTVVARFPVAGTVLRLAADTDALEPMPLAAGVRARLLPEGETVVVSRSEGIDGWKLADGRTVEAARLWPVATGANPIERLAAGETDPVEDVALRLDALRLLARREAHGLGSFLGGRIRLFPHQLHVAERACAADPVRWLLADEVGLGKTVEACLILNHLVHRRQAQRVLVVAPETLTIQWLGELWRKYHQVFALLDAQRLADVERDFGAGFNPFLVHPRSVIGLATLVADPRLTEWAAESGLDLIVVDEAHHLHRPEGHPGSPAYRAVAPLARAARHALLLTATPLEEDAHGFLRLLQLLRPDEFPDSVPISFHRQRLEAGEPLPPCTSSTRRADIGGLPPRAHRPVVLDDPQGWAAQEALVSHLLAVADTASPDNAVRRRSLAARIERALESGAALERDPASEALAQAALRADPRIRWILSQAPRWKKAGEKSLIFTATRKTLEAIRKALESAGAARAAVFHEDLPPAQRDIEVAQFRLASGPPLLLSTESGGEGRNFEFCRRVVLFDLPWNPVTVEQRIGRLDRIGRTRPVEIVTFPPPPGSTPAGSIAARVHALYEELGLFREPLGGLDRELAPISGALADWALARGAAADSARHAAEQALEQRVCETREARDRSASAVHRELHRDPFRPEMAEGILARVPEDLDELAEDTVLAACERLGFQVEAQRRPHAHAIHFGHRSIVESLPGVPGGSSFLGTFDREDAVADESIDYFASGHPLVEGLLSEMEDSPRGRAGLLGLQGDVPGEGLAAAYRSAEGFDIYVLDASGRPRPEWAALLMRRPFRTRRIEPEEWEQREDRAALIEDLSARLPTERRPEFVAWLRILRRTAGERS